MTHAVMVRSGGVQLSGTADYYRHVLYTCTARSVGRQVAVQRVRDWFKAESDWRPPSQCESPVSFISRSQ